MSNTWNMAQLARYVVSDNGSISLSPNISGAGGGATTYANYAAFPSSGNTTGDFAIALDTKALYMWDGTEWDRIASGSDAAPYIISHLASTLAMQGGGNSSTISLNAADLEGFPLTYDYDTYPTSQTSATIVNNNDGSYTITSSSNESDAGSFIFRAKVSDGVHVATSTSTITVQFWNMYSVAYAALTGGNIVTFENTSGSLNATIDGMTNNDVLVLQPGSYTVDTTATVPTASGYQSDLFRGKRIAIVGATNDPNNVVLTVTHNINYRDYNIFVHMTRNTNHIANLRLVRFRNSGSNYSVAMVGSGEGDNLLGGYARNVIFDFNGGLVSWHYNNLTSTNKVYFDACSFVNYSSWAASYAGSAGAIIVTRCAFQGAVTSTDYTSGGNNQSSVTFGTNYTYSDNGTTYGHLYNALVLNPAVSTAGTRT